MKIKHSSLLQGYQFLTFCFCLCQRQQEDSSPSRALIEDVLKQGLVTVEREPAEVNLVQTNKEVGVLGKNRKMAKAAKTTREKPTRLPSPTSGRPYVGGRQYEYVTRADPWMMQDAAASVVDVSKWILMTMPTSIMYLSWC
jgi:hypothetical protein